MFSRLGLASASPAPAKQPRQRTTPAKAPGREGAIWASVQILVDHATSPQVQCLNCDANPFCGGATRIEAHICEKCTGETDTFLDMKQKLMEACTLKQAAKKQKTIEAEVEAEADFGADI